MKIRHYAAAAAAMLISTSAYADSKIGPSTVPDNAMTVYPTPDSRVDLGPNASPLGLQQISVLFRSDVTVNKACTGTACIYLEGDDTPIQTVGVSGASVDLTQSNMGSVLFPNSCIANGRYHVTIPEGFWTFSGSGTGKSGAFDLYYEILVPQRISPAEGAAKELKEFRLEFPGYQEARLLNAGKIEFFRQSSTDVYPFSVKVGKNDDGSPANYILISLSSPVTAQGDYSLFIQAGAAAGVKYEDGREVIDTNIEALYRYSVSKIDAPAITPEEGTVECLGPFELTVPSGAEFWFLNDRAISFIYPVDADGRLSPDAAYRVTGRRIDQTDRIALSIWDNGEECTTVKPAPGHYALKLTSGLFSGSWDGEFINSAPFIYYYEVVSAPNAVGISPEVNDAGHQGIFTIDGKRIREAGTTPESLPEGLYIIDGRKKYVGR